jgi:hypothetical protein
MCLCVSHFVGGGLRQWGRVLRCRESERKRPSASFLLAAPRHYFLEKLAGSRRPFLQLVLPEIPPARRRFEGNRLQSSPWRSSVQHMCDEWHRYLSTQLLNSRM